jgi:hypothetical protein
MVLPLDVPKYATPWQIEVLFIIVGVKGPVYIRLNP